MTPSDVIGFARGKYNAVGDAFFADLDLYQYVYEAQNELSVETECIETTDSSTLTVASQRVYNFPTYCMAIKRLEIFDSSGNPIKLEKITFREDDSISLLNSSSTTVGFPQFYETWNQQIYLRPIPDTSNLILKFYYYKEPATVTAVSTLEVPSIFHMDLVNYVVREMYAKDQNAPMIAYWNGRWEQSKSKIKRWMQKRKRSDAFTVVQNEEALAVTITGPV